MRIAHRWWFRLVIGAGAIVLVVLGMAYYLMYPAFRLPPRPNFPKPPNQAEADRQDLAYLKRTLHEMDRSFTKEEWGVFDRQIDSLFNQAQTLDEAAFEMGIARAVAAANNGHTNLIGTGWGLTLNSIPVRFYWFSDGLHVVKTDPAHTDLLGAKVLKVGRKTPDELAQELHAYVGGRASLAREFSIHFMESPEALYAIGLNVSGSTIELTLKGPDGKEIIRNIGAVPTPANGPPPRPSENTLRFDPRELVWPRRDLSPVALPATAPYPEPTTDGRVWTHVLDGKLVPFSLQHPNQFYWARYLASGRVLFVQINVTMDQPGQETLSAFLDKTIKEAEAKKPQFAIVDLRSNPGGSYQRTAEFAKRLPSVVPNNGKIFILTSGNTFSAGVVTTARLKYFSGVHGEIVGEPVGDYPEFWAEAATRIVLPNSRLRVGYATGYHDWQHGCSLRQLFICYLPNYCDGVAAGNLDPTIPVSWSFSDYINGKDTAVDTILRMARVAGND